MNLNLALIDRTTYRIAAAIICITCLFYSTTMRKRNLIRNRLFMMLVVFTLIDCFTEPISYIFIYSPLPDSIKWVVSYSCQMIYYFTHFGIIPIYVFYILATCGIMFKFKGIRKALLKVPFYFLELLLLTNPVTEVIFRITGKFKYERGTGVYLAYALSAMYFVFGLVVFIRNWYAINRMKRVAMIYFMALAFIGTAVQMVIPSIKCELLCEAIGLSGIMIMIEKDDDKTDFATGAYNRNAFVQEVASYFRLKRDFKAICIRIENLNIYKRLYGYTSIDNINRQIAEFLLGYGEGNHAYHTSMDVFYMLCTDKAEYEIGHIVEDIVNRFETTWANDQDNIKLDVTVLVADCPKQLNSINDIFLMDSTSLKGNEKTILRGQDLDFLLRRIEVEKAIGRGISDKNFKLMYTPVYNKEGWNVKLSHAILQLHDEELGEIPPKEFTDVAEGTGFIEELQLRAIEGVCRFLGSGVDKSDMQMDFVLVPILSASVLKNEFVRKVKKLVDHFGVDPSLIAFVMKESYAFYAKDTFLQLMNSLVEYGIRMYISDYEAGFLGLNTIASYELEGVILDIRSIFDVDNTENAEIVLSNRINMIRQLEKVVIISGIDTREYYDKIKDVPVDYAEGAFLSVPITRNELQNKFWHGEHLLITEDGVERLEEDEIM